MFSTLDLVLLIIAGISALVSAQFVFLRRRDWRINKLFGNTSPDTFKALDELEKLRRRPDEIFYIRLVQDLKSPLTMLSGPVEQLDASESLSAEDRKMLQIMNKAIGRMERIVGQLSDFSQEDFGQLRLSLSPDYPVCAKIRKDMEYFRENANLLGITIDESNEGDMRIPLDVDKFESIFHNVLYGALKFVFREGHVNVRTGTVSGGEVARMARVNVESLEDSYFMLNVFHSGETLTEDALEAIFGKEYYYLDARDFAGVGLYYVRTLVDTHKGYIWASNSPDGDGVNFTLALPADGHAYAEEDFRVADEKDNPDPAGSVGDVSSENPLVLLVEEDADMREYISLLLQNDFSVKSCKSYSKASEAISSGALPELVIADSGKSFSNAVGFCRELRRHDLTCRIPFILLSHEKKGDGGVAALEAGVDTILEQPFKPAMLSALVKSLIRKQELTKGHVIEADDMMSLEGVNDILSEGDKLFFDTLCRVIRENAANPDLTVALLCEMLNTSRTKLYNKIRKVINISPKRFIHEYRLKIAAQLLAEGEMSVGEVADATGFNSPSYFSKAFRKRYGVMPSDVRRQ